MQSLAINSELTDIIEEGGDALPIGQVHIYL